MTQREQFREHLKDVVMREFARNAAAPEGMEVLDVDVSQERAPLPAAEVEHLIVDDVRIRMANLDPLSPLAAVEAARKLADIAAHATERR